MAITRRKAMPESAEEAQARAEYKRSAKARNRAVPESPEEARARAEGKRRAEPRPVRVEPRRAVDPPVKKYQVNHDRLVYGKRGEIVELPETGATLVLVENGTLIPVTGKKAAVAVADFVKEASDG